MFCFFRNFLDKQATFRGSCGLPPGRVQEETPTATVRKPQGTKGPLISLGVVIAMGFDGYLKLFFLGILQFFDSGTLRIQDFFFGSV